VPAADSSVAPTDVGGPLPAADNPAAADGPADTGDLDDLDDAQTLAPSGTQP